jgi:hypothetical protein
MFFDWRGVPEPSQRVAFEQFFRDLMGAIHVFDYTP